MSQRMMRSRRAKRWAALAWVVLVAAGGGATVWLQSGATGPVPAGQRPGPVGPEADPPPGRAFGTDGCPEPSPPPSPGAGEAVLVDCVVAVRVSPSP